MANVIATNNNVRQVCQGVADIETHRLLAGVRPRCGR